MNPIRRFDTLSAAVLPITNATMTGVQIFKAGEWNGRTYNVADIDKIIEHFDPSGDFRPPVKLGHNEAVDAPAFGWVTSLRRAGETLVADFGDVDATLIEGIRTARYGTVSVELATNLRRNGRRLSLVLMAVAILGAQVPAVGGLRPLQQSLAA